MYGVGALVDIRSFLGQTPLQRLAAEWPAHAR
jgi:hypothetical protein